MKKIFILLILTTVTLFFGCSDEDSTTPPAADTSYNALLRDYSVNDFTVEEALLMTAQNLYNIAELSEDVKRNILTFGKAMQDGSIIQDSQGLGDIKYPSIASVVFQALFQQLNSYTGSGNIDNLKRIMNYSSVNVNEEEYNKLLADIQNSQADTYFLNAFIDNIRLYVISNQEYIAAVSDIYEDMLLDSSSSASKTAGGGGPVGYKKYNLSANIAYLFSTLAMNFRLQYNYDLEERYDKTIFIANMIYYLNDDTKLKITYDKYLLYFNINEFIWLTSSNLSAVGELAWDINETKEIPGRAPYPATYIVKNNDGSIKLDDNPVLNPYESIASAFSDRNVADMLIYQTIGEKLLGSPAGNDLYLGADYSRLKPTNTVTNNMLRLYQKLRENGLKAPYFISEIGANTLSLVIAKYLASYGIVYISANNASNFGTSGMDSLINQFFSKETGSDIIPACELIKEYNKTIDDSAIDRPDNKGYFLDTASGGLCDIYMDPDLMKSFSIEEYRTIYSNQ